ncbi:hypothetical protein [Alicycliphilus denitrificans]|uniref:hypothetical protein n=1 Tax=Alicycliphilus denitrificans TaxID=179636 RepID=UPI00384DAD11
MITRHSHNARDGHRLETEIELGGAQVLRISTSKAMGGSLDTRGSVHHAAGGFMRHTLYEDFSSRLLSTRPKRVTQQVVMDQHREVLSQLDEVKLAVEMHYQQREQAKAGKEPIHA